MKRVILSGLAAAACAAGVCSSALAADAYDDTGAWYLSPMAQYNFVDNRRIAKEGFGYEVALGYNFAPNFAAEVAQSVGSYAIRGSGASEKLSATSLDVLYKLPPATSTIRPYLLMGGGEMTDNIARQSSDNKAWLAEAGVGLLTGLGSQTGSARWQLRTEAKYRYEFMGYTQGIPYHPGDVLVNVGLQLMFGAPTPPPPAKAAAPVAALPAPPPPPPPPPAPECHPPAGFQMDANCHIIEQKVIVRAVDFEFDSSQLTAPARQTLDDIDHALLNQPELQIEIQGYTDSVGSEAYNLKLSQRRAESVMAYLVSKGVSASVLTAKGYGEADPIASNKSAEGRAQNRRVVFSVTNAVAHVKVVTEGATDASTEAAEQGEPAKEKKKDQQ